jgi:hypothetical protein
MIQLHEGKTVEILLSDRPDCAACITVTLPGECALTLTPHEARTLATELIMSVNRAEVRVSLQRSQDRKRHEDPASIVRMARQPSWAK